MVKKRILEVKFWLLNLIFIFLKQSIVSLIFFFCFANAEGKLAATKILEIVFRTLSKHMESVHEKLNCQQK